MGKVGRQSKSGVVKVGWRGAIAKSGSDAGRYKCVGDNFNSVVACSEELSEERAEWIIYEWERRIIGVE